MPVNLVSTYKNSFLVNFDSIDLPVLISTPVIVVELKFLTNLNIQKLGGWLIPKYNLPVVGLTEGQRRRVYCKRQFLQFPQLYTPNDYALTFQPTYRMLDKMLELIIYEVT
jgi:hypothetical protein